MRWRTASWLGSCAFFWLALLPSCGGRARGTAPPDSPAGEDAGAGGGDAGPSDAGEIGDAPLRCSSSWSGGGFTPDACNAQQAIHCTNDIEYSLECSCPEATCRCWIGSGYSGDAMPWPGACPDCTQEPDPHVCLSLPAVPPPTPVSFDGGGAKP